MFKKSYIHLICVWVEQGLTTSDCARDVLLPLCSGFTPGSVQGTIGVTEF